MSGTSVEVSWHRAGLSVVFFDGPLKAACVIIRLSRIRLERPRLERSPSRTYGRIRPGYTMICSAQGKVSRRSARSHSQRSFARS